MSASKKVITLKQSTKAKGSVDQRRLRQYPLIMAICEHIQNNLPGFSLDDNESFNAIIEASNMIIEKVKIAEE